MIDAIKSEFRKIFTVRSTYVIIGLCLAITLLFAFYLAGYRAEQDVLDPNRLANVVMNNAIWVSFFIPLLAVLLMSHEYRYNTILYSLTASKNRTTVLLAKLVAVSVVSIGLTLLICGLAPLLTVLGVQLKGFSVSPQTIDVVGLLWRVALYGWAYSVIGLILSVIIRNQVGIIAALFMFPIIGEPLLTLLLQGNAKYLPFTALGGVLQTGGAQAMSATQALSSANAASVVATYVIVGWIVAWLLFTKRDAN